MVLIILIIRTNQGRTEGPASAAAVTPVFLATGTARLTGTLPRPGALLYHYVDHVGARALIIGLLAGLSLLMVFILPAPLAPHKARQRT